MEREHGWRSVVVRALVGMAFLGPAAAGAQAGLNVVVTASPDVVVPGEKVDLEITVSNDGASTATNLSVVMDYPAGLAVLANSLFAGTCPGVNGACDPGEQATIPLASLPAGKGRTFSLPVVVAGATADGTVIPFNVSVIENAIVQATDTASVMVDSARIADLALTQSSSPVAPGGRVTYTLRYGVLTASGGAPGATLSLPVPAGMTLVKTTGGGTDVGGVVQWTLGGLNPGAVGERQATFTLSAGAVPGTIVTAGATFQDTASPADEVGYQTAVRVENDIPMQLAVTVSPDPGQPGEQMDLEMTVANEGMLDRTNVVLQLEYPQGLNVLANYLIDGTCPGVNGGCDPQERATFNIGTVRAGEGLTLTMPVTIASATSGGDVITFKADVTDSTADQRRAATAVAVQSPRQVNLALVDDREPVLPTDEIHYTLSYGVVQTSPGSPGAMLTMPVPNSTTFVSASDGGTLVGDTVQWSLGSLNPGVSGERRATFAVDSGAAIGENVLAQAQYTDVALSPNQVRAYATTRIGNDSPLRLAITAGPDPIRQSETMDLKLTVTNTGALDRSNVAVRLEYPAGLAVLANSLFDGACPGVNGGCDPSEHATFNIATLRAGEGVTFDVPVRVAAATGNGGVIAFGADATDSVGQWRRAATSLTVNGNRALNLAVRPTRNPVAPGGEVTYSLKYGTPMVGAGAPGATLSFHLPDGAAFVSANKAGHFADGVVTWDLGGINPGGGGERDVTIRPDASLPAGTILRALTTVQSSLSTVPPTRVEQAIRLQPASPFDVSITATPQPVGPNTMLSLHMSVTNNTALDRTGVVLSVAYPDGLNVLSNSLFDGSCPGVNGACDPQEHATFNIGTLGAGQSTQYTMTPTVANATVIGTVIGLDAAVTDSTGAMAWAGNTEMVGALTDYSPPCDCETDGDATQVNVFDLLAYLNDWFPQNPRADLDQNGTVNVFDLLRFLSCWFPASQGAGCS